MIDDLEKIEAQIPITLCNLEKGISSFIFDFMFHLPIQIANEAKLGSPAQYWWMYPIE